MDQEGVTDQMKYLELKQWVKDAASLVVSRFDSEKDSSRALKGALKALRENFGVELLTAKQMLEKHLAGPKLQKTDTEAVKSFIIGLENIYARAKATHRDKTFGTDETYARILRKKLPFYADKWARIMVDARELDSDYEEDDRASTSDSADDRTHFKKFVAYLRRSNGYTAKKNLLLEEEAKDETSKASGSKVPQRTYAKVAAVDVELEETEMGEEETLAASESSRPKTKKGRNFVPFSKVKQENAADESGQCPCCSYKHKLGECRTFLRLPEAEKREAVRKNGICFRCLERGHIASSCQEATSCGVCGGNHHTAFHRETKEQKEEETNDQD